MAAPHPMSAAPGVLENVRFVRNTALPSLPTPWPRAQDLSQSDHARPSKDDLVVAISHAWPYQAHPDPNGEKCDVIRRFVGEAESIFRPQGASLLFFDFLSAPQRPFGAGQAPRTPEQAEQFAVALKAFPLIYLLADTTIHLDVDLTDVPGDRQEYQVGLSELSELQLQQVGSTVQVAEWPRNVHLPLDPMPFDVVVARGGKGVQNVADLEAEKRPSWWCCAEESSGLVTMRRAPFGRRNNLPAGVKGWIYLERFVSMVKSAMVPEAQIASVAFSNSQEVLDQIFEGGRKLRAAARSGTAKLVEVLEDFFAELDTKQFAATSLDKQQNVGGVGGMKVTPKSNDGDIVKELMRELVDYLAEHWAKAAADQEQRQLTLAISRGDTAALTSILEAGIDVNIPDSQGWTALHLAARMRNVENVQLLISRRADLTARNEFGNCPALVIAFFAEETTMKLFNLLAPTKKELSLQNAAGVCPMARFAVWVMSELHFKPFPPAQQRLQELQLECPEVLALLAQSHAQGRELPAMPKTRIEQYKVNGHDVPVHVWEPAGQPEVFIVWLAVQVHSPLSRQEKGIEKVAAKVCAEHRAKIFVLSYDATASISSTVTIDEYMEHWRKVIEALPIGQDPFVLVDDSLGFCTDLVWTFRHRLSAAMVISFSCLWEEDFMQMSYGPRFQEMLKSVAGRLCKKNMEAFGKMASVWVLLLDKKAVEEGASAFAKALETAPEDYWRYLDIVTRWLPEEDKSRRTRALGTLAGPFPVMLVGGPFVSSAAHLEPMQRLAQLLPGSTIEYIPYSKGGWSVEGDAQVEHVAGLLGKLLVPDKRVYDL